MKIVFTRNAWHDYASRMQQDRKILKKINVLIRDIQRNPYSGIGKPEPLKYDSSGSWSRRIEQEHRLVYQAIGNELRIISCRYYYEREARGPSQDTAAPGSGFLNQEAGMKKKFTLEEHEPSDMIYLL